MKLEYANKRFVAISTYEEKEIPKGAGFFWDKDAKRWFTQDPAKAVKLAQYADESARAMLDTLAKVRAEIIEASRAVVADVEIPVPDGLAYLEFQKAGIAYAMKRENVLVGDEMGVGKTIQAIGVINCDASVKNVLVICPASLKLNWMRECQKWLVRPLTIAIANGTWPMADVVIVNYDILSKHSETIRSTTWDLLICDEAHYLKNSKTVRTTQVLGAKGVAPIKARRRIFMTGTPILNRPIELWPLVKSLDPTGLGKSWANFTKRYCAATHGRWGWDVSGSSNLGELQDLLRSSIMVRRLKKDVLTELPAKRRQVVEVDVDGAAEAVASETNAWARNEERLAGLRAAVELSKASEREEDYDAAVKALRDGVSAAFTEISRLRHETALAKVPAVLAHIVNALESTDKVVVFAHHKDVVAQIEQQFSAACVTLTGDAGSIERQSAVDRFQNDPAVKVFIGTIGAAGVGITLTAASLVIFAELDWVPGNITQAEDRLHRIGQQDTVLVQHLVLNGSLDARMAHRLVEKQAIIDKALDIISAREPVLPTASGAATESVGRSEIVKEAVALTAVQVAAVHTALRMLSGMCDGARSVDGAGFNKMDAYIGRDLARCLTLTQRQAALGRKIATKYRRQLGEAVVSEMA